MNNRIRNALAVVALVTATTAIPNGSSVAGGVGTDSCDQFSEWSFTTTKGQVVWIPSSRSAGPFQWGGRQTLSTADGRLDATTNGHTNAVGGTVGANFGIYKAEGKYEHQWQHSTTVTNTFTSTFTTDSGSVPRSVHWRWKLYVKGWKFTATRIVQNPSPCPNYTRYTVKKIVVVPVDHPDYSYDIETYATRGHLHDMNGNPI